MAQTEVLITCISFAPNIGGLETHLLDLTSGLVEKNYKCHVLTYMPITTKVKAAIFEKHPGLTIYRIPWIGGLFYKLTHLAFLEFIYLSPGLFFALPILLMGPARNINTIHSHGLIAGFVSVFWGKVFRKRVLTTTHSMYNFPQKGLYRQFASLIFRISDHTLCLSKKSYQEITSLGVTKNRASVFTYWIDLNKFSPVSNAKGKLKIKFNFAVLFVGRLVEEKGIKELLEASKLWSAKIKLLIAGTGPMEASIPKSSYLGPIRNDLLPAYFSAADITIVPSTHDEGFGRVILESLACGTPVIAANRGAIPEALNESVGKLINISPKNIASTINYFFTHRSELAKLARKCRPFAISRYSSTNLFSITKFY